MAINVSIEKNATENTSSVLRRFQKKVRTAGFLQTVRGGRYFNRQQSTLKTKRSALVRIARTADYRAKEKAGQVMTDK
jgi:ribosomal protein S21